MCGGVGVGVGGMHMCMNGECACMWTAKVEIWESSPMALYLLRQGLSVNSVLASLATS